MKLNTKKLGQKLIEFEDLLDDLDSIFNSLGSDLIYENANEFNTESEFFFKAVKQETIDNVLSMARHVVKKAGFKCEVRLTDTPSVFCFRVWIDGVK